MKKVKLILILWQLSAWYLSSVTAELQPVLLTPEGLKKQSSNFKAYYI